MAEDDSWIAACERWSIHAPDAIQDWGALLVAGAQDRVVRYASANLADLTGHAAAAVIGRALPGWLGPPPAPPLPRRAVLPAPLRPGAAAPVVGWHQSGELLYVEIEPGPLDHAAPGGDGDAGLDLWKHAANLIEGLRGAAQSAALFAEAASAMRAITGFDRCMVYRFDAEGNGEVVADDSADGIERLLGLHYPATDVPQPARQIYLRRRVRMIPDIDAAVVPLLGTTPAGGVLDLSPSALRAVSPCHLAYIRTMGMRAALSVALTVEGRLWGLLVCQHRTPRRVALNVRGVCDLIGRVTSLMITTLRDAEAACVARARQERIAAISACVTAGPEGSDGLLSGLMAVPQDLLAVCDASGAVIRYRGRTVSLGQAPHGDAATALLDALLAAAPADGAPFAVTDLQGVMAPARPAAIGTEVAGALLLPLRHAPGEALLWLRPEQARLVAWGVDAPTDAATGEMRPSRSFAQWQQQVRGQSLPWLPADLAAATALRDEIDRLLAGFAERMRQARDEADRASRAKSEFLATMSHEIRSPLSGLLGVLELLRGTPMSNEQVRMAGMIHNSATLLLAVLNDILDFSKIDAGALSVIPEPTALRELVDEIVQPHAISAARKGIDMTLSIDAAVPGWLLADRLRLRQILSNLLSNAVKFTSAGAISVAVDVLAGTPVATLRVVVRDSGIGMTEDVMARLFNPFVQADGSTTRRFGGTGLGLAIARKLARLMDGELAVSSVAGAGSSFTLTLPLLPCEAELDALAIAAAPLEDLPEGRHVLVVDDDQTIRWLTQRQLEKLGLRVETAEDGEAGLRKLLAGSYDLLLTDCHMPRMDGVALTRAVRAATAPALRNLPVIGLTADVTDAQREICHAAGMVELAIKPLTIERMAALMFRHLPAAGLAPPAPAAPAAALRSVVFEEQIYLAMFTPEDAEGAAWLHDFLATAQATLAELAALFEVAPGAELPREAIGKTAHRLAGAAFSVGAMLLGAAARGLELAAPGEAPVLLRARRDGLADALAAAGQAIAQFLAGAPVA